MATTSCCILQLLVEETVSEFQSIPTTATAITLQAPLIRQARSRLLDDRKSLWLRAALYAEILDIRQQINVPRRVAPK